MSISRRREKYLEWLERTEVDITDVASITDLQRLLKAELGLEVFNFYYNTPDRLRTFLRTAEFERRTLTSRGIRPIPVNYPWGQTIRYVIPGRQGLFGRASVNEFLAGE